MDTKRYYRLRKKLDELERQDGPPVFYILYHDFPKPGDVLLCYQDKELLNPTEEQLEALMGPDPHTITLTEHID